MDSYAEFHEGLTIVAIALAFVLIEPVARSRTRAWSRRRIMIACGVILVGVSGLFAIRVPSVAHYVGAVHTVYQRYVFEALHRRAPGQFAASIPLDTRPPPEAPVAPVAAPRLPLNVVVVFLDAKRPENIGLYGQSPGHTPHIDKLFGSGYVFTRAYSSTSTSRASRRTWSKMVSTAKPWARSRNCSMRSSAICNRRLAESAVAALASCHS